MRIDETHKPWLWISSATLGVALLLYVFFHTPRELGSQGGTPLGLGFGIAGFSFMIFAGLLGARKKVPIWRVGRAQTWMRGHLWLGLLALPLMVLLIVVVCSGVFGAALQHYLPAVMTRELPLETIYEQIDSVRSQLLAEAEERIAAVESASPLAEFYAQRLYPYLQRPSARQQPLADAAQARVAFVQLRTMVPLELHETIGDLENLCEEERQLTRQMQLHHWLHLWLLLHVPLSLALLLLGAVHAIMALRY
jgi:hypothetical protein